MKGQILLSKRCFKMDRLNAKAMISGYIMNGKHNYLSIYCDVSDKPFPMLITPNISRSRFKMSEFGRKLNPEAFFFPFKYIAALDSEYYIKNDMKLWEIICNNGLFNVWDPIAPYKRFAESKTDPIKFRVLLLRIYEIEEKFTLKDIDIPSDRIDHLIADNREVTIKKPIIDDKEFLYIKQLLIKTIQEYLLPEIHYKHVVSEEIFEPEKYNEGAIRNISVNAYERDPIARRKCIEYYGLSCSVCGFNFEEYYGNLGKNYIHVHHLKPLSEAKEEYETNPIKDLRPVCPNCHAMLHQRKQPLSIEELKQNIKKAY